ncbi:MAG: hypothetical protein GXP29_09540 [Planctomycetes bacterium]|nr:hypothetical protein [Planctomycetota bacterium]
MEQKRFWSRMRGWFQAGPGGDVVDESGVGDAGEPNSVADANRLTRRAFDGSTSKGDRAVADRTASPVATVRSSESAVVESAGPLSKLKPAERRLEKLQDGYLKVIDLVESIREHQGRQDERAVEFSNSLSKMAETLGEIEQGNRQQVDRLANIADELRAGNERADHWQEVLAEFPKTAQAQREALVGVTKQMEAVGDRDEKMTGSLDSLREAVTALGDATTASSVAVKNLQMTAIEDNERTANLLEAQNKRFSMLFAVTVMFTVLALILGGFAIMRGGGSV